MINLCVYGVPPGHVYKGVEEGNRAGPYGAPWRSPTPTGSRIPAPSLVGLGEKEGGEREEGKGGNLLLLGVGIPSLGVPLRLALLLPSFIYRGGGTP